MNTSSVCNAERFTVEIQAWSVIWELHVSSQATCVYVARIVMDFLPVAPVKAALNSALHEVAKFGRK
jgi:hypothetical protein